MSFSVCISVTELRWKIKSATWWWIHQYQFQVSFQYHVHLFIVWYQCLVLREHNSNLDVLHFAFWCENIKMNYSIFLKPEKNSFTVTKQNVQEYRISEYLRYNEGKVLWNVTSFLKFLHLWEAKSVSRNIHVHVDKVSIHSVNDFTSFPPDRSSPCIAARTIFSILCLWHHLHQFPSDCHVLVIAMPPGRALGK